ncbi:MAG: M48 family metalloprotease [Alistipes sp.]|nr:M48 family metalloprotease [Alistipes sp.]
MKRFTITLIAIFVASFAVAQTFYVDIDATAKRKIKDALTSEAIEKGEQVKIVQVQVISNYELNQPIYLLTTSDYKNLEIGLNKLEALLDLYGHDIQSIWDAHMIKSTIPGIIKYGSQYEMREELESDALQFASLLIENNLQFDDPHLEAYIYNLVNKIAPTFFLDGRTTDIKILLNRDPSNNITCFPNGTIVINLGLLTALHSEAELVALLSHEIAHYLLDHQVQNVNAAIEREKRAAFWAAFATGVALVADVAISANSNGYYAPGALTTSTALFASAIAEDSVDRLGMEYDHEQDLFADAVAVDILKHLGYDENALATALNRIKIIDIYKRYNSTFIEDDTDLELGHRIENAGTPVTDEELFYEQMISFAVSDVAVSRFNMGRFRQALATVNQNIENNVANDDDYLLKARCLLTLSDGVKHINEIFDAIRCARMINHSNINAYKTEIITYLKIGDFVYAKELLKAYDERLTDMTTSEQDIADDLFYFVAEERDWTSRMLIKIDGMLSSPHQ